MHLVKLLPLEKTKRPSVQVKLLLYKPAIKQKEEVKGNQFVHLEDRQTGCPSYLSGNKWAEEKKKEVRIPVENHRSHTGRLSLPLSF